MHYKRRHLFACLLDCLFVYLQFLVRQQEPIHWLDTKETGHAMLEAAALKTNERMALALETEERVLCGYSRCGYYQTFLFKNSVWDHPPADGGRAL